MTERFAHDRLTRLIDALTDLREQALAIERDFEDEVRQVAPSARPSARNLLHYLALRSHDLRPLQGELASLGLSSLGRAEACTLAALNAVLDALHRLADRPAPSDAPVPPVDFASGAVLLERHAVELFGPAPHTGRTRVMVTMPSEAADDARLVRDLLEAGMDIMRINCAHDDADAWARMVEKLRQAERELGRSCRVISDLAGPKVRTGALAASARVVKVRPRRDSRGVVVRPARVWLTSAEAPQPAPEPVEAELLLPAAMLGESQRGDEVVFRDTRRRKRRLAIATASGAGALAESDRTAYIEQGMPCLLRRGGRVIAEGRFTGIPAVAEPIVLHVGDTLRLTREDEPGRAAQRDAQGRVIAPAQIPCTLGEAMADVRPGQRIWFDDGKIGGIVRVAGGDSVDVEITHAAARGAKLRSEKGINLPDTNLRLAGLTEQDIADLDFVAAHADAVALSFVRDPSDVLRLEALLEQRGRPDMGIVLKIETRQAFERLPRLLLASLRSPPVGVMVARGDLGVEVGFERLAEVQEEILWLCEAAHVPVIWATQVLESLTKTGLRSRAEITDAAMAVRAECVMLNKGPHAVEAVRVLSDILERMEAHQQKKRQMLRRLRVSQLV